METKLGANALAVAMHAAASDRASNVRDISPWMKIDFGKSPGTGKIRARAAIKLNFFPKILAITGAVLLRSTEALLPISPSAVKLNAQTELSLRRGHTKRGETMSGAAFLAKCSASRRIVSKFTARSARPPPQTHIPTREVHTHGEGDIKRPSTCPATNSDCVCLAGRRIQQEGAGRMRRPIGGKELTDTQTNPFLLLDHMPRTNYTPDEFPGAASHPHRGHETVMYLLEGQGSHEDSMGNKGTLHAGDIQWMTAGSGIQHTEGTGHPGVPLAAVFAAPCVFSKSRGNPVERDN